MTEIVQFVYSVDFTHVAKTYLFFSYLPSIDTPVHLVDLDRQWPMSTASEEVTSATGNDIRSTTHAKTTATISKTLFALTVLLDPSSSKMVCTKAVCTIRWGSQETTIQEGLFALHCVALLPPWLRWNGSLVARCYSATPSSSTRSTPVKYS